jgi:transcription elongation factor GreA
MTGQTIYLTQEGFRELEQELEYLQTTRRHEIADSLRETLDEGGDLLENTTFMEVKAEQAFVEGRINELTNLLSRAHIIEEHTSAILSVMPGSEVTVQEEGCSPESFHIVGSAEADPLHGRLSDQSPLGRALIGHRAGEVVSIHAPDGDFTYHILAVR